MIPQMPTEHLSLQEVFASTLIHSLWQGVVIVIVMWMLRIMLPKNSRLNYILALFALIAMVFVSLSTFLFLWNKNTLGYYPFSLLNDVLDNPNVLQWFNVIWLIGSTIFFFRFLFSHIYLRKLILRSTPIQNNIWIEIFERLKNYYFIHKSIILLQSDKVSSAFLTGVIKPVIIIPTTWINQLSYKEAECILAHEISHVFNGDHWVNLFIHFSEIIFYFNPAVHILIGHIKLERELKADTSACLYLGEPILYAKLILKIEETGSLSPAYTLPFFKQRKQLKRRIESVLQIKSTKNEFTSGLAILALTLGILFFGSLTIKNHNAISCLPENIEAPCQMIPLMLDKAPLSESYSISASPRKKLIQINRFNKIRQIDTNNKIKENLNHDEYMQPGENDNEIIAFEDYSHDLTILQQIEKEIKAEKNSRMTIIYEISKNAEVDSNESVTGGNWMTPRQIKYYAPVETKSFIIIKSGNAPSFETETEWNTPAKVIIQYIDKH